MNQTQQKDYVAALLFLFFLGGIGGHYFYLGNMKLGIVFFLFAWTGIPSIIALITFIRWLIMGQEEWSKQYNS